LVAARGRDLAWFAIKIMIDGERIIPSVVFRQRLPQTS